MDISLPQNDTDPKRRQKALQEAREHCTYDFNALKPLPMAASVPEDASPSLEWNAEVADALLTLTVNGHKIADETEASNEKYQGVRDVASKEKNPIKGVFDGISQMVKTAGLSGPARDFSDFRKLFIEV